MQVGRLGVDLARRADLHQHALGEDADAVGHGHRLDLVVRDVEHGRAELGLDALQLEPQIGAQLGVERGQRLVHQVDRRAGAPARGRWRRAASRRPTAGSSGCRACGRCAPASRPPRRARRISAFRHLARRRAQREGQVVEHRQMRIERILLEDEGDVARRPAPASSTSRPPMSIVPPSGRSSPAISRSVVVLPAPVGPSSTTNSPSAMCRSRSSTAAIVAEALGDASERAPQP